MEKKEIDAAMYSARIGQKIWFEGEKVPYTIRARSERYIIATKPFNPKKTVFYTIIDTVEKVRGPENLVFGMGAETDQQRLDMLKRLHGFEEPIPKKEVAALKSLGINTARVHTEVSHRNQIDLKIDRISPLSNAVRGRE